MKTVSEIKIIILFIDLLLCETTKQKLDWPQSTILSNFCSNPLLSIEIKLVSFGISEKLSSQIGIMFLNNLGFIHVFNLSMYGLKMHIFM